MASFRIPGVSMGRLEFRPDRTAVFLAPFQHTGSPLRSAWCMGRRHTVSCDNQPLFLLTGRLSATIKTNVPALMNGAGFFSCLLPDTSLMHLASRPFVVSIV